MLANVKPKEFLLGDKVDLNRFKDVSDIWGEEETRELAIQECESIYNSVIKQYRAKLNNLHNENHDTTYWKIIIGPWLIRFIQIAYVNYFLVKDSLNLDSFDNDVPHVSALNIPYDWIEFQNQQLTDDYNKLLRSEALNFIENIDCSEEGDIQNLHSFSNKIELNIKERVKKHIADYLFKKATSKEIVLASVFNHKKYEFLLAAKMFPLIGFLIRASSKDNNDVFKVDYNLRDKYLRSVSRGASNSKNNGFSVFLESLIWKYIPLIYVEGYKLKVQPYYNINFKTKLLVSAYGWKSDENFKFFAAQIHSKGGKLIGVQHGGPSGISFYSPMERHIIDVVDIYFTFGEWAKLQNTFENYKCIAFPPLSKKNIVAKNHRKNILYVGTTIPANFLQFRYGPLGQQFVKYQNDQLQIIGSLSEKDNILMRTVDKSWGTRNLFKDKLPHVQFDDFSVDYDTQVLKSSLVVIDNIGTTFVQALILGKPVVLFVNKDLWFFDDTFMSCAKELENANILFYNIDDAVQRIQQLIEEPDLWYQDPKVTAAKEHYLTKYAPVSDNWIYEWTKALNFLKCNM